MAIDRRDFFELPPPGLSARWLRRSAARREGGSRSADALNAEMQQWTEKDKLLRIASCTWPIRSIFKSRGQGNPTSQELKKKYGEITMLDFPQWTKDTFPGVTHMDIFSGLFGDVTDDSMFVQRPGRRPRQLRSVEPVRAEVAREDGRQAGRDRRQVPAHLEQRADEPGVADDALRKAGVDVGKKWLDGAVILGAKSVRMNSTSALGPSIRPNALTSQEQQAKGLRGDGYVRNFDIIPLLDKAIESYKEMADHGGKLGIKVTFENHWGLAADPMNIRIMLDTINHPYCEASPDFCNWEHEYMLFNGLKALAPYSHTNVHAKYWDRWGDKNDVQRSTRIMLAGGFKGTFALEYEAGPLNGIEGAQVPVQGSDGGAVVARSCS